MKNANETSSDPKQHCENIQKELNDIARHLRSDVERVNEPQFKALCETSAEVVTALGKSFEHYVAASEPAWQATPRPR